MKLKSFNETKHDKKFNEKLKQETEILPGSIPFTPSLHPVIIEDQLLANRSQDTGVPCPLLHNGIDTKGRHSLQRRQK